MSTKSIIWSLNQKIVLGLCAASLCYHPAQLFSQNDYDGNYIEEQSTDYSQAKLLGGAAVLGAAAGAITAACIKSGHHHHSHGKNGRRGPAGPAGTAGVAGPVGPAGAAGPQGVAGLNGLDGAPGATGATGPGGGNPFVSEPGNLTVLYDINANILSGAVFVTPFIIYPDGTVQEGPAVLAGSVTTIAPLVTTTPLVQGSYTVGLRVNLTNSLFNAFSATAVATVISSDPSNTTAQLQTFNINIVPNGAPSYMFSDQYELPNPFANPTVID